MTTNTTLSDTQRDKLYADFDRFTGDNLTVCLVSKDGEIVGRILSKNQMACTAWVQVWGFPPAKGRATGGGYDRQTASILKAMSALVTDARFMASKEKHENLNTWASLGKEGYNGKNWRTVLENAGYRVHNAI